MNFLNKILLQLYRVDQKLHYLINPMRLNLFFPISIRRVKYINQQSQSSKLK